MCLCCSCLMPPNTVERDLATFDRPWTPTHALAATPGLTRAKPDRDSPVFSAPVPAVLEAVRRAVAGQPRTTMIRENPNKGEIFCGVFQTLCKLSLTPMHSLCRHHHRHNCITTSAVHVALNVCKRHQVALLHDLHNVCPSGMAVSAVDSWHVALFFVVLPS